MEDVKKGLLNFLSLSEFVYGSSLGIRLKKSLLAFDKVNEFEYKRRFRSGSRSRRRRGVSNSLFIHGQTGWFTVAENEQMVNKTQEWQVLL